MHLEKVYNKKKPHISRHWHPALDQHFTGIMALMRANSQWDQFKRGIERAYPKIGSQLALRFLEGSDT